VLPRGPCQCTIITPQHSTRWKIILLTARCQLAYCGVFRRGSVARSSASPFEPRFGPYGGIVVGMLFAILALLFRCAGEYLIVYFVWLCVNPACGSSVSSLSSADCIALFCVSGLFIQLGRSWTFIGTLDFTRLFAFVVFCRCRDVGSESSAASGRAHASP